MIYKETIKKIKYEILLILEDFTKLLNVSFATINRWKTCKYVLTIFVKEKIRLIYEQYNIQMEVSK